MLKVGIIGCGGIADEHYDGFVATGKAKVTAVYDTHEPTMRERAAQWGAQCMRSAQELTASDVNIVVIATPGFARLDYVSQAARNGKHILCEKPVALDMETARAIRCKLHPQTTFMVHFKQRFIPELATLKAMQAKGAIGQTVTAWAQLHAPAPTERWLDIVRSGHWRASKELSGGRISEFCSHTVNWLLWVLGKPLAVYGKALYVTEGFTLDDADVAIIECEGGTGVLQVHRHAGVEEYANYGITGHGGTVAVHNGAVSHTTMDKETEIIPDLDPVPPPHEHFVDCVLNHREPVNGIDDAILTLQTCLAFNESAESGNVIRL